MGAVPGAMSAKTEFTVEDIAQGSGHNEHEKQRKIGIDPEKRCNRPIAPRDEQGQQPAAQSEADDLPNQHASLVAFTHLFSLAPASHLLQRL